MKNFKVYQEIMVRRVVTVQAETEREAELAALYEIQDEGDVFSIKGAGWAYFDSRDVVEELKE